jgi:hypothetical protein
MGGESGDSVCAPLGESQVGYSWGIVFLVDAGEFQRRHSRAFDLSELRLSEIGQDRVREDE